MQNSICGPLDNKIDVEIEEQTLAEFGFGLNEAQIYLALNKSGLATPSELSKATHIDRSQTYRVLENLVSKGFVSKLIGEKTQFSIIPPKIAFQKFLDEKHEKIVELEKKSQNVVSNLSKAAKKNQRSKDEFGKFEMLQGYKQIISRIKNMVDSENCEHEILICTSSEGPKRIFESYYEELLTALKRNVKIQILLPIEKENLDETKLLSVFSIIRHTPNPRGGMIVVDKKQSLHIYTNGENFSQCSSQIALWSNNSQFAETQAIMFESEWKLAKNLHDRINEIQEDIDPEQQNQKNRDSSESTTDNEQIICITNSRGRISHVFGETTQIKKHQLNACIGSVSTEAINKYIHPKDRRKVQELWRQVNSGKVAAEEFRTLCNGKIKWWKASMIPILKQGKIQKVRTVLNNITREKRCEQAERASQELENLYKTMIQTSMDGFWVTDLEGNFLQVNEAYCKLLGYTCKEMLNMNIHDVEALENPNETIQHIQRIKQHKHDHFETQHKRKDGATVNLEVNVNYVEQEQEKLVVFLRDITKRRQNLNGVYWSQQQPEVEAQTMFQQ